MLISKQIQHADPGPVVIWDVVDMVTLYGTVFGIEVSRQEISLLCGSRTVNIGRHGETIMVSDRIILNPFTAKRLLVRLRKLMVEQQKPSGMKSSNLHAFMENKN